VGKTTLIRVLESNWKPQQQPVLERNTGFIYWDGQLLETAAMDAAIGSDLVLFVTNGI